MQFFSSRRAVIILAVLALTSHFVSGAPQTLVATGSVWKYLDSGVNLGTAWRSNSFKDATWASGPAPLGYGEMNVGQWPATTNSFGPDANNKFITTYYRRDFVVPDPAIYAALSGRLLRDDGAVVYLNGIEIFRSSMPTGTVDYLTLASTNVGGLDEITMFPFASSTVALRAGSNVIAVEIHQSATNSTDTAFDLLLEAVPNGNPAKQHAQL